MAKYNFHKFRFITTFETALREECRYMGAQPYWDFALDVSPPENFPNLHSSILPYDFGGNGPFIPVNVSNPFEVPGWTGEGCIKNG